MQPRTSSPPRATPGGCLFPLPSRPLARHAWLVAALLVAMGGCSSATTERAAAPLPPQGEADHDHDWNRPGEHHGLIVKISPNEYHAEAVFEKGGAFRLFPLGADWREILPVETQELTAYLKQEGAVEAVSVVLKPAPQTGDPAGKTSQFVGQVPAELLGRRLEVSIPLLRIGERRFALRFHSEPHEDEAMPKKVVDEDERRLYLTPGGKYTEADIKANGVQTASQKYAGFRAAHDFRPKPGTRLCPITQTKANPACTWIVGGKSYEFCCPPCIDEFVQQAKEKPETIQPPEAYVKP